MSTTLFRFIVKRVARTVVKRGVQAAIEETTGIDIPGGRDVIEFLQQELGGDPQEASPEELEAALNRGVERGRLSRRQVEGIEETTMADFNQFMSVGLSQCGSDRDTFAELVEVWNREKDEIRTMTVAEVRQSLTCP